MLTAGTKLYGNLPIFPTLRDYPHPITEDRIERAVERLTDVADHLFMTGGVNQQQYDRWVIALENWANDYINHL
jgi:hypothetical protein